MRPELVRRLADAISNALDGLTPDTLGQARTAAWALAQLTREGTLEAERIEALRNRMDARELDWRNDPAALYIAYAYRLMRLTDEADELQKAAISIDVSKSEGNDTLTLGGIPALASAVRLAPTPEAPHISFRRSNRGRLRRSRIANAPSLRARSSRRPRTAHTQESLMR